MTTAITIRSHNRTEAASDVDDAKIIARKRAESFATTVGGEVVWCGPECWGVDEPAERCLGGYAVTRDGQDIAEGAAVIIAR